MCIFCSLSGSASGSAARGQFLAAGLGGSPFMLGEGASGDLTPGANRFNPMLGDASGTAMMGTSGPGVPAIAEAYDHTGNVFLDVIVGWGWLDVGGDRNITYYFDHTPPPPLWR